MSDYKKAREDFEGIPSGIADKCFGRMWIDGDISPETYNAILKALQIAEVVTGDISLGMIGAGKDRSNENEDEWIDMYSGIFKAMINQMMKEIEDEQ